MKRYLIISMSIADNSLKLIQNETGKVYHYKLPQGETVFHYRIFGTICVEVSL